MKNKFLILIVLLIVIFIGVLSIYKFGNNKNNNKSNDKSNSNIIGIVHQKQDLKYSDVLDEEKYKNYISYRKEVMNYSIYGKKSINGQIYIDDNSILHITNEVDKEDIKASDIKFKYLHYNEVNIYDSLFVYLISEDNRLYTLTLKSEDLGTLKINPVEFNRKVLNFATISYNNDISPSGNTLFVLCDDGNMYEVGSRLRYHENINLLFDNLMVYEDNTMTNIRGNVLEDKNGNPYKIKYAFRVNPNKDYLNYDSIMIVTEDNKLLSILDADKFKYVYEDKIKNISFDKNYPFELGKLDIEFEDGEKITFDAKCSIYNCINDLDV